jgi:hypothetical protein
LQEILLVFAINGYKLSCGQNATLRPPISESGLYLVS